MADTFTTSLSIRQIETGTRSGTWGTETNTQYELLDNAFSYVNHDLSSDADATLTISDGTASDARYFYIKFTSSVSLTATRTITLAPDDSKKIWIVENATTGSQSLTFKQGSSGGTVTVVNGNTAVIYADGAGATNGAITNAFTDLQLAGTTSMSVATVSGDLTVDTDTLYVDSTNNRVGIGTTSPDRNLHISAGSPVIVLEDTDGGYGEISGSAGNIRLRADEGNTQASSFVGFEIDGTEKMRLDTTGLGIGQSSPSQALDVAGRIYGSSNEDIDMDASASGHLRLDGNGFASALSLNATGLNIYTNSASRGIVFGVNETEKMRLDTSGNLLVGKTSAGINGEGFEATPAGYIAAVRDGGIAAYLQRKTSDGDIVEFRKDTTTVGSISATGDDLTIGTGDTGIRFVDATTSIQPINTSTGARVDDSIILGAAAYRFKDLYLSDGIYLTGTTAADYLDDYEEGTWTPQWGNVTNTDFTIYSARYTKIGRMVILTANFEYVGTDGSTYQLLSTSIPFINSSSGNDTTAYHNLVSISELTDGGVTTGCTSNIQLAFGLDTMSYSEITGIRLKVTIIGME